MSKPTKPTRPTSESPRVHHRPGIDEPIHILLVEDEPIFGQLVCHMLGKNSHPRFSWKLVVSLAAGLESLAAEGFDVVLLDLTLPDSAGLATLHAIRRAAPEVPVVVFTGYDNDEWAVQALQAGAQDYLLKSAHDEILIRSIFYAIERCRSQNALLESQRSLQNAQLQLMQADKLETLGRLAAGVAHEVKNPLGIIRMGIDFIERRLSGESEEERSILRDMNEAARRAMSIINEVLDFSAPGDVQLLSEDLNELLEQSVRLVQHLADPEGIEVHLQLSRSLPPVCIDRRKIQQVLLNLMENAIQAMPGGGQLTLRTSSKVLDKVGDGVGRRQADQFRPGQPVVVVEVLDTGTGISEEIAAKVFDPFFTTKPTGQGSGLGLSISQNIMGMHHGRIQIENRGDARGARARLVFAAQQGGACT